MSVRRSVPIHLVVALVMLAVASSAQSRSSKHFARIQKPLSSVTLDLDTGTISRGPVVNNRAATTCVDFFNTDLGGFTGVDTGAGFCEWFDAGVKGSLVGDGTALVDSDKLSDLMNSIVFAYCSAKLDPSLGGPGGSVRLGFYEGYTTGGGTATTAVAMFTLTGLPANTRSSSFFAGFRCYFIRIIFGTLIPFADGPIGYSWKFQDLGTGIVNPTGGVLAATFPFLACVQSCSGVGVDGQGMEDLIDQYCPPGTLRSTFTFGTTSGTFTSINMSIEEVAPVYGTVVAYNSCTFPNPDILTSTAANIGQPFSASLTLGFARQKAGPWVLFFGSVKPPSFPLCAGIPLGTIINGYYLGTPKSGRMLLCSVNIAGFSCTGAHTGVLGSSSSTNCGGGNLPLSLALVCNPWCAQAVVFGNVPSDIGLGLVNIRVSSGVSGIVGTN